MKRWTFLASYFRLASRARPRRAALVRGGSALVWCTVVASCSAVVSCNAPLEQTGRQWELWDESGEELRRLPAVARLHLRGVRRIALEDLWLVQGEVSTKTSKKLAAREVPPTLAEKRQALSSWTAQDEIILAPGRPFVAGGVYTLLALGVGVLAELRAADETSEMWMRWGDGAVQPGARLAYCKMNRLPLVEFASGNPDLSEFDAGQGGMGGAEASPGEVMWGLPGGLFAADCLMMPATPVAGSVFVPPPNVGVRLLDPQAVWLTQDSGEDPAPAWEEEPLGHACAGRWGAQVCPEGAALVVSNTSQRAMGLEIFVGRSRVGRVALPAAVSSARLGPIAANTEYQLRGVLFDEDDAEEYRLWSATVHSGPGDAQFVITEVMADPTGPEPQGEWIEVQNVGTRAGSLGGFFVGDESGWSPLPDVELRPEQFGLIVRRDFAPSTPLPAATASPLWVEELGGNGLRNSGEVVQLLDRDGAVVSTMLAKKSAEGISLARTTPWAADQPDSFVSHGAPGASPGADNTF